MTDAPTTSLQGEPPPGTTCEEASHLSTQYYIPCGRPAAFYVPTFKAGDLPPEGYLQWHEWAEVQRKAGIRQVQCPTCAKWKTPQELSTNEVFWLLVDRKGNEIKRSDFECTKCFDGRQP